MEARGASFESYQEIPSTLSNRFDSNISWREINIKSVNTIITNFKKPIVILSAVLIKYATQTKVNQTIFAVNQREIRNIKPTCPAGGYPYRQSDDLQLLTRNRKIELTVLELTEVSFDFNLINSNLRIKFEGSHIASVPHIYESNEHVFILIATSTGIFRFQFIHPNTQHKDVGSLSLRADVQSIFSNATLSSCLGSPNYHMFSISGPDVSDCVCCCAFHSSNDSSVFAFSHQTGSISCFNLPHPSSFSSTVLTREIKQGVMSRFLGGLVTSVMRSSASVNQGCASMCMYEDELGGMFICGVTFDYKIKLWSISSSELLLTEDPMNDDFIDSLKNNTVLGSKNLVMKYIHDTSAGYAVFMAVYLHKPGGSQFQVYRINNSPSKSSMELVGQVEANQANVIDYIFDIDVLYVLLESPQEGSYVQYHYLDCSYADQVGDKNGMYTSWFSVRMHKGVPKTSYKHATSVHGEKLRSASRMQLKQEVSDAIEDKLHQTACEMQYDMEEFEFLELHHQQWSKFYASCVYFYKQSLKYLGIVKDSKTGLLLLIKTSDLSVLRTCDVVDRYLLGVGADFESFGLDVPHYLKTFPNFQFNGQSCHNLNLLREYLAVVSQTMSSTSSDSNENEFCKDGDIASTFVISKYCVKEIAEEHIKRNFEFLDGSLSQLNKHSMNAMVESLRMLVDMIDLRSAVEDDQASADVDDPAFQAMERQAVRLFFSKEGMRSLCTSIEQLMTNRYKLACNVLSLIYFLKKKVQGRLVTELNKTVERLVTVMNIFRSIIWSINTPVFHVKTKCLDSTKKVTSLMKLICEQQSMGAPLTEVPTLTLMELFVATEGRGVLASELTRHLMRNRSNKSTPHMFCWPNLSGLKFVLSLLYHGQHVHLQTYIHNMVDYFEECEGSFNLILGLSSLVTGEPEKALYYLQTAGEYLDKEKLLMELVEKSDLQSIKTYFYLLVMELFEEFNLPSCSIDAAHHILPFVSSDDPKLVTLWIKVFKNSMDLELYDEAFTAILMNQDKSSRRDCLRQYFMKLYEEKEYSLIGSKANQCHDLFINHELIDLLEQQARMTDFTKQSFYELLHAIHYRKKNYQAAATVLYELGMKWGYEVGGMEGLTKMIHWIRTCISCLHLLQPLDAFVLLPAELKESNFYRDILHHLNSKKINSATEKVPTGSKVVLLDLNEIERENFLSICLLCIYNLPSTDKKILWKSVRLSPDETLGLLCNAGIYDKAFILADHFNLSCSEVFESLTMRFSTFYCFVSIMRTLQVALCGQCIRLSNQLFQPSTSSLASSGQNAEWLDHNYYTNDVDKQYCSEADRAWRYLKFSLENYESTETKEFPLPLKTLSTSSTTYHRAITKKLLSFNFALPAWLVASYKHLDAPELMHVLWEHGEIPELTDLIVDYMQAVAGRGSEAFNITASEPELKWEDLYHRRTFLPYTLIHEVVSNLEMLSSTHPAFKKMLDRVTKAMNGYLKFYESHANIYHLAHHER
ncbi:hypothetical protein HELRODRAFT_191439 [Helobdella robusta]|uniref:Uncharacterized protein n=1 Tax=Helobdella robusta TaxID=6412 RepID=T1FSZ6_HELRO|nr:hypothetical protein HELRODRAFT_191439 [Helobdella robusta]ESO05299.1 hypothetical protein HELRODRAFT_191439 [Helobdella robusta]